MQQDLNHQGWTIIAGFLSRADRFALIGLCRSVVHSPLRAVFFAKTTWRVPPIEILATKVFATLTMKRFITSVRIDEAWQHVYLSELPALDGVEYHCGRGGRGRRQTLPTWLPVHLKRLQLEHVEVPLDLLLRLTKLETLSLNDCDVMNSDATGELLNLTQLRIDFSPWEQIDWGRKIPNLRSLVLSFMRSTPHHLAELQHLEVLNVFCTDIANLEEIVQLAMKLKALALSHSLVENAGVDALISRFVQVEQLYLHGLSRIDTNVTSFSGLVMLNTLSLDNTIADLQPLRSLTNLEELSLIATCNVDWSPIEEHKKLHTLSMSQEYTTVNASATAALHKLPLLTTLKLLPKLSSEYPLLHVRELKVSAEDPREIKFDAGCCPNVVKLTASGTFDLTTLVESFSKLTELSLTDSRSHEDFDVLARLTQLDALCLTPLGQKTFYRGFAFLAGLTTLRSLELAGTTIEDLSVLKDMRRLKRLDLDDTPVDDITVLSELESLRVLSLQKCANLRDVSSLCGHPSLTRLLIDTNVNCAPLVAQFHTEPCGLKEIVHGDDSSCLWTHFTAH